MVTRNEGHVSKVSAKPYPKGQDPSIPHFLQAPTRAYLSADCLTYSDQIRHWTCREWHDSRCADPPPSGA